MIRSYNVLLVLILVLFSSTTDAQDLKSAKKVVKLMGCGFEVSAISDDENEAWKAVEAGIKEIERIEKLISSWNPNSQTSKINNKAGIDAVRVDYELFQLINRSMKISALTEGAFDISFASMDKIWCFGGEEHEFPAKNEIEEASSKINWKNIICDKENATVFLKEKGMRIGFGGIGKGYAANRAIRKMKELNIEGALVNASGDIMSWGKSLNTADWNVIIADPKNKEKGLGNIRIENSAIVTSGNYERFFTSEGKRYSHIIDPRTGIPTTGIKSVTVVTIDAEIADALATSVFVLGVDKGLKLINSLKNTECLIIDDSDQIITSAQMQLNYY
jgi:thiamine biosynthesis lipoprotein